MRIALCLAVIVLGSLCLTWLHVTQYVGLFGCVE